MRKVIRALLIGTAVAAVTGTLAVQWRAAAREADVEAAFPPTGTILQLDGQDIHYVQRGSGPDLVLIHGANGTTRDMTFGLTDALAARYRVTVFDRPGLGYSGRTRPELEGAWTTQAESPLEQGAWLARAADALGLQKPLLMGHSLGGAVALGWALERPDSVSGLVLVGAVSNPWPGKLDILYRVNGTMLGGALIPPLATAFVSEDYVNDVTGVIFDPQPAPEGYVAEVGATLALRRGMMRANARQVYTLRDGVIEMVPRYGSIAAPVEIVHGDADTIVPIEIHSRVLAGQIPGAVLTVLPGIGHMPHHVARAEVIAAIDRAAARAGLR